MQEDQKSERVGRVQVELEVLVETHFALSSVMWRWHCTFAKSIRAEDKPPGLPHCVRHSFPSLRDACSDVEV